MKCKPEFLSWGRSVRKTEASLGAFFFQIRIFGMRPIKLDLLWRYLQNIENDKSASILWGSMLLNYFHINNLSLLYWALEKLLPSDKGSTWASPFHSVHSNFSPTWCTIRNTFNTVVQSKCMHALKGNNFMNTPFLGKDCLYHLF